MGRNGIKSGQARAWWQWGAMGLFLLLGVILFIPSVLVNQFEGWESSKFMPLQPKERLVVEKEVDSIIVPVYLSSQEQTVDIPLEQYVRGVLAAEMPADFELEALKAQAIAARTYLVRRLEEGAAGKHPGTAIITDTIMDQAFATEETLRERWGFFAYARNIDKLTKAVNATQGLIATYEGKPIEATFFSTSNGYTENSENVWAAALPYLRSVESPWDRLYSPNFKREMTMAVKEVNLKLGLKASGVPSMKVLEKAPSGRALKVQAAGKTWSGREFREKLGLPSTDVAWVVKGDQFVFTTLGYGHGVGMSQWGANGMAKQGKTADQILQHYYSGVQIEDMDRVLSKAQAFLH